MEKNVKDLQAQMEELKAQMAKAREELNAAKAAAKKANGRPIRKWAWLIALDQEGNKKLHKGDVHYCEEEKGIKAVKDGVAEKTFLFKVNKATDEKVLVSTIYRDEDGIVVID